MDYLEALKDDIKYENERKSCFSSCIHIPRIALEGSQVESTLSLLGGHGSPRTYSLTPLSNSSDPNLNVKTKVRKNQYAEYSVLISQQPHFSFLDSLSIALKIFDQPFNVLHRNGIVIADSDATNTPVTLQTLQKKFLRSGQELLFLLVTPAVDSEADVHPASDRLVWNNTIYTGVLVEHVINELSFLVCDFLLAPYFLRAEGVDEAAHDLSRDPKVEDWEGVVEGVVLCDRGIVEHDGTRNTAKVQLPLEGWGWGRSLWWEERLPDNDDGDTCYADVFLRPPLLKSFQYRATALVVGMRTYE